MLGHELPAEAKEARAEMGVVPQLDNLDVDVSVQENLAVFARLVNKGRARGRGQGPDLARSPTGAPTRSSSSRAG